MGKSLLITVLKNVEKFYKGNCTKEVLSILNKHSIHPLIQTCKGPDILLELTHVRKYREF